MHPWCSRALHAFPYTPQMLSPTGFKTSLNKLVHPYMLSRVCTRLHRHTCMRVFSRTHTQTNTHTCMRAHAHTFTPARAQAGAPAPCTHAPNTATFGLSPTIPHTFRPWLSRAAAHQEHAGGRALFTNPCFIDTSTPPTPLPSCPTPASMQPTSALSGSSGGGSGGGGGGRAGSWIRSPAAWNGRPAGGSSVRSPSALHPSVASAMAHSYSDSDEEPLSGSDELQPVLPLPPATHSPQTFGSRQTLHPPAGTREGCGRAAGSSTAHGSRATYHQPPAGPCNSECTVPVLASRLPSMQLHGILSPLRSGSSSSLDGGWLGSWCRF